MIHWNTTQKISLSNFTWNWETFNVSFVTSALKNKGIQNIQGVPKEMLFKSIFKFLTLGGVFLRIKPFCFIEVLGLFSKIMSKWTLFSKKKCRKRARAASKSSLNRESFYRILNCQESWNFENWKFEMEDIFCLVCKLKESENHHSTSF